MKIKKLFVPVCLAIVAVFAAILVGCGDKTPKSYTVTFDLNYTGSTAITQTVDEGKTVTKPEDPTLTGSAFTGWYTAATGGTEFDFNSAINADTTVYAQWEEAFVITINYNYEGAPENSTVYVPKTNQGASAYEPEAPTREGYGFGGWFTAADGTGSFSFARRVTADTTIYASWKKQLVMEAEYVDLTGKSGPGFSGTANGNEMIGWDEKGNLKASNEFFVGFLYSNSPSTTLTFTFNSVAAASDVDIVVRMSAEFYTQTFSDANYTVSLNGSALTGWISPTFAGTANVETNPPFVDVIIATNRSVNAGANTITLATTNTTSPGGTMQSQSPLIDCVKVASSAELSWNPKTENFGPDGFPNT